MKRKLLLKIGSIFLASCMIIMSVGCASKEEKQAKEIEQQKIVASTTEVNQNDYRGGYMRVHSIQDKVVEIVNNFNVAQNKDIIQQNPSNYWNSSDFQYFVNDFLQNTAFEYTPFLNETQTDWETVEIYTKALFINPETGNYIDPNTKSYALMKNGTNDYNISYSYLGLPEYMKSNTYSVWANYNIHCTYDANHDWVQMINTASYQSVVPVPVVEDIVEYGRQKNTNSFIIQFPTERLYITYETLEGTQENEYNPLAKAKVTSFAYSKLSGKKLPYYVEKEISQIEEGVLTSGIGTDNLDEEGNIITQYGPRDSIFPHFDDITADWVCEYPIEEGYYDKYIYFDGKDMTIYNQNHMSNQMEIIEFHSDGTIQDKTLSLQETLTPFTLNWVNEDGSLTGSAELFVNETHDLTDENGNVLIAAENALYNKDNRVIVTNEFLQKIGYLKETEEPSETESEEVSEETVSEEETSEKGSEKAK